MTRWRCALELDSQRKVVAGSTRQLADAVARGADLRIYTEFRHNEHIDVDSKNQELIREVAEFGVTYRIEPAPVSAGLVRGNHELAAADRVASGVWRASVDVVLSLQPGWHASDRSSVS
jgi:hypothetical protein